MGTINGGPGNDFRTGGVLSDTLRGFGGNDLLQGLGGDDILDGGTGFDRLEGGPGDDTYIFRPDFADESNGPSTYPNTITENLGEGTDTVQFTGGILLGDLNWWINTSGDFVWRYDNDPLKEIHIEGSPVLDPITGDPIGTDVFERLEQTTFGLSSAFVWSERFLSSDTDESRVQWGTANDDFLNGNGGDDALYGFAGIDSAFYDGLLSQHEITKATTSTGDAWTIADQRPGSPDGTDTLFDMERAVFSDRAVFLTEEQFAPDAGMDDATGADLLFRNGNGDHLVVNGETGQFSFGIGRPTSTMLDIDDFTGDGIADILFSQIDDIHIILDESRGTIWTIGRPGETYVASLDLDGDGAAELLFQRANGNHYAIDNTSSFVTGYGRAGETVLGVGDFDGDGGEDLLMARSDGSLVWVDGETRAATGLRRDPADEFLGIGDFDGDGADDVLLERATNGSKAAFDGDGNLVNGYGRAFQDVNGIGDFDGDGADDILFAPLFTNNHVVVDGIDKTNAQLVSTPGQLMAVGDYRFDAGDEMVFQDPANGRYSMVDGDGTPLVNYARPNDTLLRLDPMGTGDLIDLLMV